MQSVSFILKGDGISQSKLDNLIEKLRSINKHRDLAAEYILYFSTPFKLTSMYESVSLVYSKTIHRPIEKAVATACGSRLIFTTIDNLLYDKENRLLGIGMSTDAAHVWVEFRISNFEKILGIRHIKRIPFLIVTKPYAVSQIGALPKYKQIIKNADRQLSLGKLPPSSKSYPDYMVRDYIFLRPYGKIIKRKYQTLKSKLQVKIQEWEARKLSQRVSRAVYSPDIPVFIICRDRVEPLKELIKWCEDEGLTNIILIDNNSTYPPLLEYLATTKHEVIRLKTNVGHTAPWDTGIINIYAKDRAFIVSDPDIIPSPEAHGAVKLFCELLNRHLVRRKAGFGLRIDDIPESFALKELVITWEKVFWETQVEKNVYDAEIDTTFAVYRPGTPYVLGPGLRTGGKFVARHEPWYVKSKNPSPEMIYYREHANKVVGSWGLDTKDVSITYINHHLKTKTNKAKRLPNT